MGRWKLNSVFFFRLSPSGECSNADNEGHDPVCASNPENSNRLPSLPFLPLAIPSFHQRSYCCTSSRRPFLQMFNKVTMAETAALALAPNLIFLTCLLSPPTTPSNAGVAAMPASTLQLNVSATTTSTATWYKIVSSSSSVRAGEMH